MPVCRVALRFSAAGRRSVWLVVLLWCSLLGSVVLPGRRILPRFLFRREVAAFIGRWPGFFDGRCAEATLSAGSYHSQRPVSGLSSRPLCRVFRFGWNCRFYRLVAGLSSRPLFCRDCGFHPKFSFRREVTASSADRRVLLVAAVPWLPFRREVTVPHARSPGAWLPFCLGSLALHQSLITRWPDPLGGRRTCLGSLFRRLFDGRAGLSFRNRVPMIGRRFRPGAVRSRCFLAAGCRFRAAFAGGRPPEP